MRLKNLIFLTIFAIGVMPLLTLVGINLRGHINRHEQVEQERVLTQANLVSQDLSQDLEDVKIDLVRYAGLLEEKIRLVGPDPEVLAENLVSWFGPDQAIFSVALFQNNGQPWGAAVRGIDNQLQIAAPDSISWSVPSGKRLVDRERVHLSLGTDSLQNGSGAGFLSLAIRVQEAQNDFLGLLVLRIRTADFLGHHKGSLWMDEHGSFLHVPKPFQTHGFETKGSGLDLPGLGKGMSSRRPFVWEDDRQLAIAWLPLVLEKGSHEVFWIGQKIDRSGARQWKRSLIVNIILILLATMVVVYIIAQVMASRVDRLKEEILHGLDRVLNREEEVTFTWSGPREISMLAQEMTALANHYVSSRRASRKTEKELRESEDRFRRLTASAQDAIIMMDHDGNIAFWNMAAEKIFGYTAEEALGSPAHGLLDLRRPDGADQDEHQEGVEAEEGDKATISPKEIIELTARTREGQDLPIELSLAAARIKEKWHAIWVARDISERKKAEEEARFRQQQLIQADKMRSLGLLVSGVAHEINNPNSIAILNTPLLSRAWQSVSPILEEYFQENGDFTVAGLEYSEMREQVPRLFRELDESSKKIRTIVKDLKDYARQETSRPNDPVDLNQVVDKAVRLTHNQVKKATSRFQVELAASLPMIKGSSQRLEQVLINLIQNGCEALPHKEAGLTVRTVFDQQTGQVLVTVEDQGEGIDNREVNRIIDPFFTTKRDQGGTGLGLSVSAGIVKEHNGTLRFESEPNKGTRAIVAFPVEKEE